MGNQKFWKLSSIICLGMMLIIGLIGEPSPIVGQFVTLFGAGFVVSSLLFAYNKGE